MSNWAKVDNNNIVKEVLVFDDGVTPSIELPSGWQWIEDTDEVKNVARIDDKYDSQRNAFIRIQPFASWTLDENTCTWEPPVAYPNDNTPYVTYKWNESTQSWDLVNNG
jgi:hypothetical protein